MRIGAQVGIITAVCFTLATVVPVGAAAQPDSKRQQAKAFFDAGKRFYEMQNWRAAIDQFKQAAKILPSPILDYNIGICHEKLGQPRLAVSYYQRYLAGAPKADNRSEVESKIKALEEQASAEQPPAPGAPPPAPLPEDDAVPPAPPPPPEGYYDYGVAPPGAEPPPPPVAEVEPAPITSRWWFWALIGAGVLVLVAAMVAASNQDAYNANAGTFQLRHPGASPAPRQLQAPQPRGFLQPMQPAQPRGLIFRF